VTRERRDHNVVDTPTQQIRVLGPRTVQETRSSHWYGCTVSVRVRKPGGDWREIHREDLRGVERWDREATNRMGGLGALVTDVPSDAEIEAAVNRARAVLGALSRIEICTSPDGDFIRAVCRDGERDITPSDDCALDDPDVVRFEVQHDLVGGWGQDIDWNQVEVVDRRGGAR
jgi:hypothetical protein